MTIVAEIDGKVVGASFGMPDYNPRIKEIDGRLFPFGVHQTAANKRAIKKIRLISTNVLPEYQMYGIGLVLMHGLMPRAMEWGLEEAEFSWVLESNSLSYGSLKKGGAKITKTYRLFDLEWEEEARGERRGESERDGAPAKSIGDAGIGARNRSPFPQHRSKSAKFARPPIWIDSSELPWRIYEDDPHWIPPLMSEVKAFLDRRKHPFYQHGDATQFIALRGGETVGRILVSDDPNYNQQVEHERRLLRHVRIDRRRRNRPCAARCRGRLAARSAAARASWDRSTIPPTIPAAC